MKKLIARIILHILGWKISGKLPDIPQYVMIVAPHRSAWEIPLGWAVGKIQSAPKYKFMLKEEAVHYPVVGNILLKMGAMPIERNNKNKGFSYTDEAIAFLEKNQNVILILAPEGTRKNVSWRTSFYYIALKLKIPIVMGVFNTLSKMMIISDPLFITGDKQTDFTNVRSWYFKNTYGNYLPKLQ